MIEIVESEMVFGPFKNDDVFRIEKCKTYSKLENLKIVEFVLLSNDYRKRKKTATDEIWLIEAKSSSPKPNNDLDFSVYIKEIKDKFQGGLCLFLAFLLERYPNDELSKKLKSIDLRSVQFKFILVIKNHKEEWLGPIKDTLQQRFISLTNSFNLGANNLVVLNENLAQKYGIIS